MNFRSSLVYTHFDWWVINGCSKSRDVDVTAALIVSKQGNIDPNFRFSKEWIKRVTVELKKKLSTYLKRKKEDIDIHFVFLDKTDEKYTVIFAEKSSPQEIAVMIKNTGRAWNINLESDPELESIYLKDLRKINMVYTDPYIKIFMALIVFGKAIQRTKSYTDKKAYFKNVEFSKDLHKIWKRGILKEMIFFLFNKIDLTKLFDPILEHFAEENSWPMEDTYKKLAFQIMQTLARLWGLNICTKETELQHILYFSERKAFMAGLLRKVNFENEVERKEALFHLEEIKNRMCRIILELIEKEPVIGKMKLSAYNYTKRTIVGEEVLIPPLYEPIGLSTEERINISKVGLEHPQLVVSRENPSYMYVAVCGGVGDQKEGEEKGCGRLIPLRQINSYKGINFHKPLCSYCLGKLEEKEVLIQIKKKEEEKTRLKIIALTKATAKKEALAKQALLKNNLL